MRPSTAPAVLIRASKPARVVQATMAGLGAVVFTGQTGIALARGQWTAALFLAAFASLWLTTIIRSVRAAVFTTTDDRLVVRNVERTWRLDRSHIADLRRPTGLAGLGEGNLLSVVLVGGKVIRLQATSRWPVGSHRAAATARERALRDWLRTGSGPDPQNAKKDLPEASDRSFPA